MESIDPEDKQGQGVGVFETDVQVMGQIPKNTQYEIRITYKRVAAGHKVKPARFVDIREYWFREGPMGEPVPTKKGIMVKESSVPGIVILLLQGQPDSGISKDDADAIRSILDRKTSQ